MVQQANLLGIARFPLGLPRDRVLLLFVAMNLAFLCVDVAIAHSVNSFVPAYEWLPVFIPLLGVLTSAWLGASAHPPTWLRVLHVLAMFTGVAIGILGTAFHFRAVTPPSGVLAWAWVVFGAPVLAPISFAGVSLVGLITALEEEPRQPGVFQFGPGHYLRTPLSKTRHLLWLVGLGFLGAAATSFLDHAQYGYTLPEWIPVAGGIFATVVVIGRAVKRSADRGDDLTYFWTMLAMIAVGIAGLAFHLSRDLADNGRLTLERMRDMAPVLAPTLFSDLGLLGLLVVVSDEPETAVP